MLRGTARWAHVADTGPQETQIFKGKTIFSLQSEGKGSQNSTISRWSNQGLGRIQQLRRWLRRPRPASEYLSWNLGSTVLCQLPH